MKLNLRPTILRLSLLALIAAAFLVAGCASSAAQSASNTNGGGGKATGAAGLTQTSQEGSVTIKATWENPSEAGTSPVRFAIVMDTHSVDLDSYDLGKLAMLRTDQGIEVAPDMWDAPPGGHHRSGQLTFPQTSGGQPVIGPQTARIELVIRDVAGVKERSLQWEVSR
ncbi:MAG: hypothetical protein HYY30_03820 [Chloroflexi bacterium]|nr:hypothetical protein [Chloroflexota bacterium]